MAAISQMTFSKAFSLMKMYEFRLRLHWSLFMRFELTISQHWFKLWLGAVQVTSHYLNQWWLVYRRLYGSLGLNDLNINVGDRRIRVKSHELHGVSNHLQLNRWFNSLFMLVTKITPLRHIIDPLWGESSVDSPHKGPVIRNESVSWRHHGKWPLFCQFRNGAVF